MFPVYFVLFCSLHMINSVGIFIITFLKAKGAHTLDTWEGNKLKFSHCVLCFTNWLDTAYENSTGVYLGFLMYNLKRRRAISQNIWQEFSLCIRKKKMKGVIKFLCVCLTKWHMDDI